MANGPWQTQEGLSAADPHGWRAAPPSSRPHRLCSQAGSQLPGAGSRCPPGRCPFWPGIRVAAVTCCPSPLSRARIPAFGHPARLWVGDPLHRRGEQLLGRKVCRRKQQQTTPDLLAPRTWGRRDRPGVQGPVLPLHQQVWTRLLSPTRVCGFEGRTGFSVLSAGTDRVQDYLLCKLAKEQ